MRTVLRCPGCGLPFARLEDGQLIIESRHHGETHINRINVAALEALARLGENTTGALTSLLMDEVISDGPGTEET